MKADTLISYLIITVMAQYRSRAMAHRFNIEAVQHKTSDVSHNLHMCLPNSHRPNMEYATFNGNTKIATVKSAEEKQ
jgi:hypothetical protein